ncbi:hypothetical protein AAF712_013689 [Marasmius tenuissimus]|uniref:PIPK domain-containing protein n=1 Tax=Marasmius tenuissimus TaxID=585030 RepID=A0ABR2ZEY2_9AGAR
MEDKPLPAIPSRTSHLHTLSVSTTTKKKATRETPHAHKLTTLCLKAREHRNRFIRFVLDEASEEQESTVDVEWVERNKDELVWTIEDALDDLGKSMGQGGWLVGIRRAKSALESEENDDSHQDEDEDKIRQLRELAAQPNPPTPLPVSKHLLLCLAPVGSRVALPEQDSGFDIIPTQIQCTFKPGVFAFPDQVQGSVLLYGYDEWSSSLLSSTTPLRVVGGTFQFASVPGSSSFHALLSKVIKLTVYQHLSLLLEQHLWADAGVPLTFPSPSSISASRSRTLRRPSGLRNRVLSHGATSALQRPKLGEHKYSYDSDHRPPTPPPPPQQPKPQASKGSIIPLPNGILSFFSKRSLGRSHSPKSQESDLPLTASRGASLDIRSSPDIEQDPVDETPARSSMDSGSRSDLFGSRIRRFSFSSSAFHSLSPTSTLKGPQPPKKTDDHNPPALPFTSLLNRLTESKELFSTSPGVGKNIDLPSLLIKLAERERDSSPGKIRGDERAALKELLGWDDDRGGGSSSSSCVSSTNHPTLGAGMLGTKGFLKHQAITALASVHVPVEDSTSNFPDDDEEEEEKDNNTDQVELAIQEQQTTPPTSKAPSPETSPSTPSIASMSMSIPTPKSKSKANRKPRRQKKFIPCANTQPPRWETFAFSGSSTNTRTETDVQGGPCLGEMIRDWLEGADRPCIADTTYGNVLRRTRGGTTNPKQEKKDDDDGEASSMCKMKRGKHEVRFIHGGVRVTVVVSEMDRTKRELGMGTGTGVKSSSSSSLGLASSSGSQSLTAPTAARAKSDTGVPEKEVKDPQVQQQQVNGGDVEGSVEMWMSCAVCEKDNWGEGRISMSDGTFLLPFGKFLELLIYSPSLCTMDSPLCEHTRSPQASFENKLVTVTVVFSSSILFHRSFTTTSNHTSFVRRRTGHLSHQHQLAQRRDGRGPTPTPTPSRIVSNPTNTTDEDDNDRLPSTRFNIVRNFSSRTHVVSFSIDVIDEVFELRVPRVQIVRGLSVLGSGGGKEEEVVEGGGVEKEEEEEEEKKKLRREIKVWWEGVGDHVDMLETRLGVVDDDPTHSLGGSKKSLPRLPSSDDAYDDFDPLPTPRPGPEGLPPAASTPTTPTNKENYFQPRTTTADTDEEEGSTPTGTPKATRPVLPSMPSNDSMASSFASDTSTSSQEGTKDPTLLLSNLRQTFHRTEQSLYTQLSQTSPSSLNEVRRAFLSAAKGVERRLAAWQKKHMGEKKEKERKEEELGKLSLYVHEPRWWHKSCHVVPGGNIIVREDDWGSIIAFTLGTDAFKAELGAMSGCWGSSASSSTISGPPPSSSSSSSSSFFSTTGYRLFRSSAASQPDPDQEDVIWHEPEAYSAVISRKEHPRDPSGLLSIREVLRQKAPGTSSSSTSSSSDASNSMGIGMGGILSGSRIATLGREGSRLLSSALGGSITSTSDSRPSTATAPPSAWSKPDVQISKEAAGGEVISGLPTAGGNSSAADKIIQELDAATASSSSCSSLKAGSEVSSRPGSAMSGRSTELPWSNFFGDAHIKRGKAPSILSIESNNSTLEAAAADGSDAGRRRLSLASAVASKGSYLPPPPVPVKDSPTTTTTTTPTPTSSSRYPFSTPGGLTTAIHHLSSQSAASTTTSTKHHGLLSAEIAPIDERPHIKYDWTVGKRLKFSCTAYYAKQFDILRKRCGVDDIFLRSLSKSQNWSAEGGKSKSNFWKTSDDRFIIKTLVNAWNVADLQVLIDLAPSYFRYLDSTASKATVLAKLVGFYTIEIRNLETGTVQSKADLLVMENLFYNQHIDKTFDLKGIQGRKVKAGAGSSKTLFDGEWIEGQQQTLTLVRPHSKLVLREAIRNDAEFLARSNIMDYSLLLGVDTKSKEIACGLVDTIGSYTFAKTLEYKAKQGLSAGGKEVTVVPPNEYQERFVSALERYFLACPGTFFPSLSSKYDSSTQTEVPLGQINGRNL